MIWVDFIWFELNCLWFLLNWLDLIWSSINKKSPNKTTPVRKIFLDNSGKIHQTSFDFGGIFHRTQNPSRRIQSSWELAKPKNPYENPVDLLLRITWFFLWISELIGSRNLVGFKTHLRMVIYEVCGMISFASWPAVWIQGASEELAACVSWETKCGEGLGGFFGPFSFLCSR